MRVCFTTVVLSLLTANLFAQEPQPDQLVVTLADVGHTIVFRRLPKNDDILPLVTKAPKKGATYEAPSLYLAEKEASLFDVKALVSDTTWTNYQKLVLRFYPSSDDVEVTRYRKAITDGSKEYPAILVDLPIMIEMCQTLNKQIAIQADNWTPALENTFFRIPTRSEWQYAARSITDPAKLASKELFPEWAEFDVVMKGKLQDILERLKRSPKQSVLPRELVAIGDELFNKGGSTRTDGYKLLGKALKRSLQLEVNIAVTSEQQVFPLTSPNPNAWNFHRMIGNVPEWVLEKDGLSQADEFWVSLSENSKELVENKSDFGSLMGGSFVQLGARFEFWKNYSVAHGSLDEDQPWKVNDLISVDTNGDVTDNFVSLKGGIRLLVRRQLSPTWFVMFRREMMLDAEVKDVDKKYLALFQEICTVEEAEPKQKTVGLYERFRNDNDQFVEPEWWKVTGPMLRDVVASFETTEKGDGELLSDSEVDSFLDGIDLSELSLGPRSNKDNPAKKDDPAAEKKDPPPKIDFFRVIVELDQLEARKP